MSLRSCFRGDLKWKQEEIRVSVTSQVSPWLRGTSGGLSRPTMPLERESLNSLLGHPLQLSAIVSEQARFYLTHAHPFFALAFCTTSHIIGRGKGLLILHVIP